MVSTARVARIALLGFSRIERASFDAFFRFASRRCPAYAQAEHEGRADFVVVDAADPAACAAVRRAGLLARTVAVGAPALEGALLQQPRPLNLMRIVRALDHEAAALAPPAEPTRSVCEGPGAEGLITLTAEVLRYPPAGAAWPRADDGRKRSRKPRELATTVRIGLEAAVPDTTRQADPGAGAAARKPVQMDHILVVDDSDIALRFMASHLQRFGFQIHLAQSGEDALRRLAERHFEFVFVDLMMRGLEGVRLCKTIKRTSFHEGERAPTVVMITSRAVDKLRGTMAGADACLSKPLREVELLKLMGEREVARHAYAETGIVSTS